MSSAASKWAHSSGSYSDRARAGRRTRDARREQFRRKLARAQAEAKKQRLQAGDLWDRLFEADLCLLAWLDRPRGDGSDAEVLEHFLDALGQSGGGSRRERKTIHEQFEFIRDLLRSPRLASRLEKIRERLPQPGP